MNILNKIILLTMVVFLPVFAMAQQQSEEHRSLEAVNIQNAQSLYPVQTEWINQNNETVRLADFAGQPLIMVMFYGKCTGTCPVLIQRTWNLYNRLDESAQQQVQVFAVSFDYKNDTPQALNTYAEMEQLDLPGWHFVTADHPEIRELAMLLGVQYRERNDGHFEHTNLITVLDGEGRITERVSGLQQPLDDAINRIHQLTNGGM